MRAVDEPHCQVELFHSITVREERLFRTSELTPYTLASQTRVYVRIDAGEWLMGRVSAHDRASGKLAYEIRFPNGQRAVVPATDVHARSLLPKLDPTDVLAASGIETQFFSDRRRAAIEAIVRARAASRGLTGLLSAAVELVPHQLEVIRRVLEDPTQRYLLADEVGMGKTIEAGIIIRQCLLDVPASRVLVLVPEQLVHQWQRELIQKFGVRDFTSPEWGTDEEDEDDLAEARVQVLPFEALPSLMSAAGAARGRGGYDLVVVDEAHHLVADQQGTLAPAFGLMQQLAQASRRLLLLSATPILGNERAMLALLNLLDPLSNPIDDLDGFKRKIAWREQLGEIQAALSPTAPSFALRRITARLREELPDDPAIPALADQLADAGNLSADEKAAAVRAIKLHLAETYRLHQRLLRTRRKDTAGWELLPRQGRIVVEPDLDDRAFEIADALENWRFEAHRATLNAIEAGTADAGSYERQLAQRYVALFEAFGRGADELARELEMQIAGVAARTLPTFSEDQLAMEGLAEALAGDNESSSRAEFVAETVRLMLKALTVPTPRIVAFGSSAADVQTIHAYLADPRRVWSYDVFAVLEGMSPEAIEAGVDRFRASARPAVILCDRAGEEGLNFQFADAILHLDLPLSPQRLEQRIGRLDRFGRTADAIRHRVMLPSNEDDLPWQAWLDVVQQGFGLFDASMSEVQFLLALLTEQVELALFRGGAPGLREKLDPIRDQLEQERKRLDYQHALDQYEMGDDDAGQLFTQFDEAEGDEHAFAIALNDWMLHVLQLDRSRADQDNRFTLPWSRATLLPTADWRTVGVAGR
ncbi:MAG: protein DpdE, partial [Pirellulaceae bacterium]